mmetsp:Transcript_17120/g.25934  ORF Transcript_17120/g.25934 Transcript_17120/m.25934 type:complete len:311 (+) Transcript_17120:213-1145(+)|eukprot:CAMPEP_0178895244 /NCGR_PEP_ID=MMETSP0786-20121207/477_1 /TAXON_ID=186022 /ORGANISM="Thalassionema frauenfeldii, Strain CCMP 1798" /LENGTH=310 /DNA_ID=CAMNT_0020565449 /DNA_START=150 /DNA_END=1082 /DNA_ORIENTATION=+
MVARQVKATSPGAGTGVLEFHPSKLKGLEIEEDEFTQGTADESDESDLSNRSGQYFSPIKYPPKSRASLAKQRSNSILKPDPESAKYISYQRRSWKSLPVPDKATVQRSHSLPPKSSSSRKRTKSLRFGSVHFRNFDQMLGDHPSTSYGPPISLDWHYEDGKSERLDSYEESRGSRRPMKQLMLNYYQRKNILMWQYGYSETELKKATKQSEKAAFQRSVTKYFLPVSKVEEALQSAGRKAKRAVSGKDHKKVEIPTKPVVVEKKKSHGHATITKSRIITSTSRSPATTHGRKVSSVATKGTASENGFDC